MASRGRGRGRGRGIPINYPDGWACKTASDGPSMLATAPNNGVMPAALTLGAADQEELRIWQKLRELPSAVAARVGGRSARDIIARYSDRYHTGKY